MAYSDILGNLPESPVGRDFDVSRPVETFVPVGRAVVLQPLAFFTAMPRIGGYVNPLVFALICSGISGILAGLLTGSIRGLVVSIVVGIVGEAIGLFLVAAVANFLVNAIVGAGRANLETTFRIIAYSSVTSIVRWVPVLGALVGLYSLYLGVVGVREVYQTTTTNSVVIAVITGVIVGVIYFVVAVVLFAAIFAAVMVGSAL